MNFNGKFWHKPGHLGMTTAQVREALASGVPLFVITLGYDEGDNPIFDKTRAEIFSAIEGGKYPVLIEPSTGFIYNYAGTTGTNALLFQNNIIWFDVDNNEIQINNVEYSIAVDNTVTGHAYIAEGIAADSVTDDF